MTAKRGTTDNSVDLVPVVLEARSAVLAAARVYYRHTRPWFVGLLLHGSALKGGFIPGCSDIDLHLYLKEGAFDPGGQLPLGVATSIHQELAQINMTPFTYLQCYALSPASEPVGWIRPIPGTYHMLQGELPVSEAIPQEVIANARKTLEFLNPGGRINSLLGHGGDRGVGRELRFLCTEVWPALYSVLTLQTDDPIQVWRLRKEDAMALYPRGNRWESISVAFTSRLGRITRGSTLSRVPCPFIGKVSSFSKRRRLGTVALRPQASLAPPEAPKL